MLDPPRRPPRSRARLELSKEHILDLPSEALRRDFKFRIRIVYAGEEDILTPADTVLWFVDDVKIEATE